MLLQTCKYNYYNFVGMHKSSIRILYRMHKIRWIKST